MAFVEKPFEYTELYVDTTTDPADISDFTGFDSVAVHVGAYFVVLRSSFGFGLQPVLVGGGSSLYLRKTPEGLAVASVSLADDPGFETV